MDFTQIFQRAQILHMKRLMKIRLARFLPSNIKMIFLLNRIMRLTAELNSKWNIAFWAAAAGFVRGLKSNKTI